ncbi:2-amino-4-hydroxy-6-hydroxymethyldihydropteridine diphosphokinase [Marinobacter sp. BGYM27]|uniref:2-amino-4-hydroxy-6- hydroxymethyldihydropteridine diphosphokinase n=1 Tax=Marinobacter sp. BGYM27 TaxID=2975597 RepID=UPI0021A2C2F7|nr:2-amino-4-hydroxy-6-hydroxymethyldihydropteridine diphosphokinase [Marinobacter sp. BGYM27]
MSNAARVYISIGSNIERERHIHAALNALAEHYGRLTVSSVYESEAVGFDGEHFLNLVVGLQTEESVSTLSRFLKALEAENGRHHDAPKFSARTLDLDILTYDDRVGVFDGVELPRSEILTNAFVLCPLAEIAPVDQHPVNGQNYTELWSQYARDQKLWVVPFSWRGEVISPRAIHSSGDSSDDSSEVSAADA